MIFIDIYRPHISLEEFTSQRTIWVPQKMNEKKHTQNIARLAFWCAFTKTELMYFFFFLKVSSLSYNSLYSKCSPIWWKTEPDSLSWTVFLSLIQSLWNKFFSDSSPAHPPPATSTGLPLSPGLRRAFGIHFVSCHYVELWSGSFCLLGCFYPLGTMVEVRGQRMHKTLGSLWLSLCQRISQIPQPAARANPFFTPPHPLPQQAPKPQFNYTTPQPAPKDLWEL